MYNGLNSQFANAKEKLNTLKEDPGNEVKLRLYSLYKQATIGTCTGKKPSAFDFMAKAKWEAWNSVRSLSKWLHRLQDEHLETLHIHVIKGRMVIDDDLMKNIKVPIMDDAKKEYIKLVENLVEKEGHVSTGSGKQSLSNSGQYDGLLVSTCDGITTVKFNRPIKKNALTTQMYRDIAQILSDSARDSNSMITLFTGTGDSYCSGNDLGNFSLPSDADIAQLAKNASALLRDFVDAFIDFPKPLVAAVNGPATGISVTLLGLFDVVYASDKV
ncbi:enoyl-CoA delta isomerase 2, mitochondrial-like [Limulus polyphemus]|uniref:Enoyl-CoA delta isomerase 2, mitochondrial-like n=1 Tax=Limulus polyphemus TaxID=6850 RepID=A0ABM1T9P5_LIMPO|nr:enoyl-CoA delta isomerase 2, mitochondrial-like [Limulus polyphemus]